MAKNRPPPGWMHSMVRSVEPSGTELATGPALTTAGSILRITQTVEGRAKLTRGGFVGPLQRPSHGGADRARRARRRGGGLGHGAPLLGSARRRRRAPPLGRAQRRRRRGGDRAG